MFITFYFEMMSNIWLANCIPRLSYTHTHINKVGILNTRSIFYTKDLVTGEKLIWDFSLLKSIGSRIKLISSSLKL